MRHAIIICLVLSIFLVVPALSESVVDPFAVMETCKRLAVKALWPGYDPGVIPTAIYDGSRTYLFHHPQPPEGFVPIKDKAGVWVFDGLFEAVRANSSVDIGGVRTATVLLDSFTKRTDASAALIDVAAVVIHEKFHVFQRKNHPDWQANEASLFVYPVTDATLLTLRRLETEALRRAVTAKSEPDAAGWASDALNIRAQRFDKLGKDFVAYEKELELVEGTAHYLEYLVAEKGPLAGVPDGGFASKDVRHRGYVSGRWMAILLDRFDPDWKQDLESGQFKYLDDRLRSVLALTGDTRRFTENEKQKIEKQARLDVESLKLEKAAIRKNFLSRPGYRIIIVTEKPFWPAGFDPMNVEPLNDREVLHTRWLKLKNETGAMEVLNSQAMTEGLGAHPLFNGMGKVTLTGLLVKPSVVKSEKGVILETETVKGVFRNAAVSIEGQTIRITLKQ